MIEMIVIMIMIIMLIIIMIIIILIIIPILSCILPRRAYFMYDELCIRIHWPDIQKDCLTVPWYRLLSFSWADNYLWITWIELAPALTYLHHPKDRCLVSFTRVELWLNIFKRGRLLCSSAYTCKRRAVTRHELHFTLWTTNMAITVVVRQTKLHVGPTLLYSIRDVLVCRICALWILHLNNTSDSNIWGHWICWEHCPFPSNQMYKVNYFLVAYGLQKIAADGNNSPVKRWWLTITHDLPKRRISWYVPI